METIKPIKEKEEYLLEDKDYLLITTLRELTTQIQRLVSSLNK